MEKGYSLKKKMLILGAGFGGLRLYNNLKKDFDVLLIDRKTFFEFSPEVPASFIDTSKQNGIMIDLESHAKPGTYLQATMVHATPDVVQIQPANMDQAIVMLNAKDWNYRPGQPTTWEGQQYRTLDLLFDYCVVAIGAMYPEPIGSTAPHIMARKLEIQSIADRLASGNYTGVSIVGGGYVGVEMACYAQKVVKDKKLNLPVRLYNRGPTICKNVNDKAREYILKELQKKDIHLLVNQPMTPGECRDRGELAFDCRGTSQSKNKGFFQNSFALGEDDCLIGNDYMQVQKKDLNYCPNFFAIGDCVTLKKNPAKLGFIAMNQADFLYDVFETLRKYEKKGKLCHIDLQPRRPGEEPAQHPQLEQLNIKGYSTVKEPQILTMRLGSDVILVTKKKVFSGHVIKMLRSTAYSSSFKALKDSTIGNFISSINKTFGSLLFS